MRHETLVAIDWDDRDLPIHRVVDFIRREGGYDAVVAVTPVDFTKHRTGETVPSWRVTFDADRVRNTEVHGSGFRNGFVVHIE